MQTPTHKNSNLVDSLWRPQPGIIHVLYFNVDVTYTGMYKLEFSREFIEDFEAFLKNKKKIHTRKTRKTKWTEISVGTSMRYMKKVNKNTSSSSSI